MASVQRYPSFIELKTDEQPQNAPDVAAFKEYESFINILRNAMRKKNGRHMSKKTKKVNGE
ncbi:MAG: hypothetical protein IAE95_08865 [Chitinophagaceae bacterium]|nr:hypothetical protein [Chitinophagaceae bacterium]